MIERHMVGGQMRGMTRPAGCTSTSPNRVLTLIMVDRSSTDQPTPTCSVGCVKRAAGARMADLISLLIWQPMGAEFEAEITCDGSVRPSTTAACRLEHETSPGSVS